MAVTLLFDDEKAQEIKGVMDLIYEKIEGAYSDVSMNQDYKAEMKKLEEHKATVLNAFGKPLLPQNENGEKAPVKFLGTFGKKREKPDNDSSIEKGDELDGPAGKKLKE